MRKKNSMMLGKKLLVLACLSGAALMIMFVYIFIDIVTAQNAETLVFASGDDLMITADNYIVHDVATTPFIVMFHQDNWSRGEFRETAPRFNRMGFNCIAVDLRSGNKVRGVQNMTALRAVEMGKQHRFVDAMQDMIASLNYVRHKYNPPVLLTLGSSYSASLVLKIAGDYPNLTDGVLAFSPAEYFTGEDMGPTWVSDSASKINIPVFITSARKEKNRWSGIYDAITTKSKNSYIPATAGKHGSRVLWDRYPENAGYWTVIETFLKSYF